MKFKLEIEYKAFYKYQLSQGYVVALPFGPVKDITSQYITLSRDKVLRVKKGYAWDGASGPVIDSSENMRGSLIHDALYQLLRSEALEPSFRDAADQLFRDVVIADGIAKWRAWSWYYGLKWFGMEAANPSSRKEVRRAP